jgi:Asparagine synthase/Glutamine amidotransferase domain
MLTPVAGALNLWFLGEDSGRPAIAKAGLCAAAVAGRLHNRDSLATLAGSLPVPATDSELVLSAYLNGGEPALRQLRGAFVVLVFDGRKHEFVALRDPLGYYPLFFAIRPDGLLLSPSQEQLLRQEGVSREVDRAAAAGWVLGRSVDGTFFVDTARLMPGHLLRFDGDGVRTERYWRPRVQIRTESVDVQSVEDQFDQLLSRAIDRCLDLGPAGVLLSGGIDSAAIAAVATDRSRGRGLPDPVALSIKFPEPASDESTTQRAVASALGIPHVLLPWDEAFGPEGPLLDALALAKWRPVPPSPWDSAYGVLARTAAKLGCRSTIGGDATEWLAHEFFFAADLLGRLDLAGLLRLVAAEQDRSRRPRRHVGRALLWTYGARALLLHLAARFPYFDARERVEALRMRQRMRSIPPWLVPDPTLRRELAGRWLSTVLPLESGSFYTRARLGLLDSPDMALLMESHYERSRRLGIESLDGFQDPELIEFLLTVPPDLLIAGGRNKSLAQASIRRRLPEFDLGLLRNARFDAVVEELLVAQVQQALDQLGGLPILGGLRVIDPAPLLQLAAGGNGARLPGYNRLWYAVSLEAWLRARL